MEYWEFLIQKEGDRTWLPLESPDVEILEGRYRVVARSSRANQTAEIRVIHESTDENPPKRRVKQRSRRINQDGLMVVLPYTYFKPGLWELRCVGDLMTDMLGNPWQYSVQLQVLPRDSDAAETSDMETNALSPISILPVGKIESSPHKEIVAAAVPEPETSPASEPEPMVARVSEAEASPVIPAPIPERSPQVSPQVPAPAAINGATNSAQILSTLRLVLPRHTFVARWGHAFTLSGQLAADGAIPLTALEGAQIRVQLRDPQSSQLITETRSPLASMVPPVAFSCTLKIPFDANTRLILGEVALVDATETLLTTESFSITADVNELLGAVREELYQEESLTLSTDAIAQYEVAALHQSFHDLVETIKNSQPLQSNPSSSQVLPPLLYRPEERSSSRTPQLPSFGRSKPLPVPAEPEPPDPAAVEPAEPDAELIEAVDLELVETPPPPPPPSPEPPIPGNPFDAAIAQALHKVESQAVSDQTINPEAAAIDLAFGSLKLEERFWNRINALAKDTELSEWLKTSLPELPNTPPPVESEVNTQPEFNSENQEFVVEDELPEPRPKAVSSLVNLYNPSDESEGIGLLSEDEPVPTPILEVPSGELIAGRRIKVRVRLPQVDTRLCVKLWVNDRQTRLVLDGPHLLVDFWPTGLGDLETTLSLTVPFGTVEVQYDAIAMEIQTQRESHKVTLTRPVMPPPPALPLEPN